MSLAHRPQYSASQIHDCDIPGGRYTTKSNRLPDPHWVGINFHFRLHGFGDRSAGPNSSSGRSTCCVNNGYVVKSIVHHSDIQSREDYFIDLFFDSRTLDNLYPFAKVTCIYWYVFPPYL